MRPSGTPGVSALILARRETCRQQGHHEADAPGGDDRVVFALGGRRRKAGERYCTRCFKTLAVPPTTQEPTAKERA